MTVLDTSDGSYGATYRVLAAGAYQLSVTIDGVPIAGSPFATTVQPGATCASRSSVAGDGKDAAVAGSVAHFAIKAVDCYGNPATSGGDPFTASLVRGGMSSVASEVLDHRDGTYTAFYTPIVSGLWLLHVTMGGGGGGGGENGGGPPVGSHAIGSPYSVVVMPGKTDARASLAVGDGTSSAAIGEKTVVLVRTKDAKGNDRAKGGDFVQATLTQRSTHSVVHAKVKDTGDGSYSLSYVLTTSALPHDYMLDVRVNNASIGGSPFRVRARPGPTVCEQTLSVQWPKCVAGAVSEAPIFAKDRLGNQRTSGGDLFSASLERMAGSGDGTLPPTNASVQVGDNGDGTYRAMWVVTSTGKHRLWIAGPCGPISGSPYDVECVPASLSATHSQLSGAGAHEGVAGALTPFAVIGRDVFDNVLLPPSASSPSPYAWGLSLSSPSASYAVVQDMHSGGGEYRFLYNATKAGTYELLVGAKGSDGKVNA